MCCFGGCAAVGASGRGLSIFSLLLVLFHNSNHVSGGWAGLGFGLTFRGGNSTSPGRILLKFWSGGF